MSKDQKKSNLLANRHLARQQKGFDQIGLAADGKPGKTFKPPASWNLGLGIQPVSQQDQVFLRNAALAHPQEEMGQQSFGEFFAPYFRHWAAGRRSHA